MTTATSAHRAARGAAALGFGLALVVLPATAASADTTELTAVGKGANETKPGDDGATVHGTFGVDAAAGEFCYRVTAKGLDGDPAAMHIHKAPAGVDGPVVIPLDHTAVNGGEKCTEAKQELLTAIEDNPGNYYLNVHTAKFPAGAARGQLSESAPTGADAGTGGQADGSGSPIVPVVLVGAGLGVAAAGAYRFRAARR